MSESKQGTTPEAAEGSGGNENSPGQESNKNKSNYNTNNKGGKIRKHHNEHESLQYEGSNPKIGGILALRNENFSKKVSLLLIFKFIILKLYLYSNIIIFDILQEPGVLPFYPIYGDANKLNNFGGASVVYMWMKGAPPSVHDHIYFTFLQDINARYFITSQKRDSKEYIADGLKFQGQVQGCHSGTSSGKVTFYFYSKLRDNLSRKMEYLFPTTTSMQVKSAFEFGGKFHNVKPKEKDF